MTMTLYIDDPTSNPTDVWEAWKVAGGHLVIPYTGGHHTINGADQTIDCTVPRSIEWRGKLWFRHADVVHFLNPDPLASAKAHVNIQNTGKGEMSGAGVKWTNPNFWRAEGGLLIANAPTGTPGFETARLDTGSQKGQQEHCTVDLRVANADDGVVLGAGSHRHLTASFTISGASAPFLSHGTIYGTSRVSVEVQDGVTTSTPTFDIRGPIHGSEWDLFAEQPTHFPLSVVDYEPTSWQDGQHPAEQAHIRMHLTHATAASALAAFWGPNDRLPLYRFTTGNPHNQLDHLPAWFTTTGYVWPHRSA
jgi:hypothetical protein